MKLIMGMRLRRHLNKQLKTTGYKATWLERQINKDKVYLLAVMWPNSLYLV